MLISKHHDELEACQQVYLEEMGKYSLHIKAYKCELFTTLAKIVSIVKKMEWGWKQLTGLRQTMVLVRKPFFHYDPVRCSMPTLYGTVSERAAKTIWFNTLWQWKGYIWYILHLLLYILDMRRIRRFLTPYVAKTIATSLIGSELDYSNSVLYNVTEKEISKLQGVQNCLARVVAKSSRFCHIALWGERLILFRRRDTSSFRNFPNGTVHASFLPPKSRARTSLNLGVMEDDRIVWSTQPQLRG